MQVLWAILALIVGAAIGIWVAYAESKYRTPVEASMLKEKWDAVNEKQRKLAVHNHHH